MPFALLCVYLRLVQRVLHLPAVSAGVHVYRAAYCGGNAVGEFQPGKSLLSRKHAQPLEGHTCRTGNQRTAILLPNDSRGVLASGYFHHHAADA